MGLYNKVYQLLLLKQTEIKMTRIIFHEFYLLSNCCLFNPYAFDPVQGSKREFKTEMPLQAVLMNQFFGFRTLNLIFENFKFHFDAYYREYLRQVHVANRGQPSPPGLLPIQLEKMELSDDAPGPSNGTDASYRDVIIPSSDDESVDSDSRASRSFASALKAEPSTSSQAPLSKKAKRKLRKATAKTYTLLELQRQQAEIAEQIRQTEQQVSADAALANKIAQQDTF
jgi:hypothetical protein